MTSDLLLRNARLVRDGSPAEPVDVLISDGTIVAIGSGLPDAAEVVDLEGRYLMNGLWDHHVHFQQWAVSRQHLDLSGTTSAREVADRVRDRLATNPPPAGTALFGYGFRDGLWPDAPLKSMLDEVSGDVPVALASGDLHCGWLNSAAIRKIGAVDRPSGLLRETEFVPVMQLQAAIAPSVVEELVADAARTAASRGIVGVVELQNARWTGDDGAAEGTDGRFAQHAYGVLSRSLSGSFRGCSRPARRTARDAGSADAAGVRSRDFQCDPCDRGSCEQAGPGRVREGRLWWDDRARAADRAGGLPPVPAARGGGERPAVHALDDRDVVDRHWAGRTDRAFAFGGLLAAGAELRLGSDAPVAPLDPWLSMAAAVHRSDDGREPWHPEHEIRWPMPWTPRPAAAGLPPRALRPTSSYSMPTPRCRVRQTSVRRRSTRPCSRAAGPGGARSCWGRT